MEFLKYCKNHFKYKFFKILLYGIIALLLFSLTNFLFITPVQAEETEVWNNQDLSTDNVTITINRELTFSGTNVPFKEELYLNSGDGVTTLTFTINYNFKATTNYLFEWFFPMGTFNGNVNSIAINSNGGSCSVSASDTTSGNRYPNVMFSCSGATDQVRIALKNNNTTVPIIDSGNTFKVYSIGFYIVTKEVSYPEIESRLDTTINQNNTIIDKITSLPSTILNGVKEFFDNLLTGIIDGLKSLFIPEDGYFESWFNDLKSFFEEKLGFLATPFTIFIDFINMYLDLDSSADIVINIPNITVPNFEDKVIVSATTFNWSQTLQSKDSLNTLWQLYLSFIDVYLILNFIGLCETKYNRMFGGDTTNYEYYTVEDSVTYDHNTGEVTGARRNERTTTRKKV